MKLDIDRESAQRSARSISRECSAQRAFDFFERFALGFGHGLLDEDDAFLCILMYICIQHHFMNQYQYPMKLDRYRECSAQRSISRVNPSAQRSTRPFVSGTAYFIMTTPASMYACLTSFDYS